MLAEALLITIFLLDERADTYRHRKYDSWVVLPIPSFNWSCPAESVTASLISLYLLDQHCLPDWHRNAANLQHPRVLPSRDDRRDCLYAGNFSNARGLRSGLLDLRNCKTHKRTGLFQRLVRDTALIVPRNGQFRQTFSPIQ